MVEMDSPVRRIERTKFAGLNWDDDPLNLGDAERSLHERLDRERVRPSSEENDLLRAEELSLRGDDQHELSCGSSFKGESAIERGKNSPNGSTEGGGVRKSSDMGDIVDSLVNELTSSRLPTCCVRRCCVRRSPYPDAPPRALGEPVWMGSCSDHVLERIGGRC